MEGNAAQAPAGPDESARRLDLFLAKLGHEVRNPLAAICNAAQLLSVEGLPEEDQRLSREVMLRQARLLARLVDDLLDTSRLTHGRIELLKQPVDLAPTLQTVIEATRPMLERSGHQLTLSLPPEPITLEADVVLLIQALTNLLINAASSTPGSGHIEVRAEREGAMALLRVSDNGIGIPADQLDHIFDAEAPQQKLHPGFGIGLRLARELIWLHGGTIEAHSEGLGHGSEFLVRLPLAAAAPVRSEATVHPQPDPRAWHPWYRLRVLVVDDNADAARVLSLLIGNLGFKVRTVTDGALAAAEVAEFRPGTVFLDLDMPGVDGYEVARRLREQPFGAHLKLIALSGWDNDLQPPLTADLAEFDRYMVKPADPDALMRVLFGAGTAESRVASD